MFTPRDIARYAVKLDSLPYEPVAEQQSLLRRWLDRLKEGVAFAKDILDVLIKLAPLALLPPAMMIWKYLANIGWSELFFDSVGSVAGLSALLVSAAAFLFVLFLQFCIPSLVVLPSVELFQSRKGFTKLAKSSSKKRVESNNRMGFFKLVILYFSPSTTWTFLVGFMSMEYPKVGAWALGIAAPAAFCVAGILAFWLKSYIVPEGLSGFWPRTGKVLAATLFVLLPSFLTASSFLALIWIVEYQPLSYSEPILVLALCSLVSPVGLLPGLTYLDSKASGLTHGKTWRNLTIAGLVVGYAFITATLMFAPVSKAVFGVANIYDGRLKIYQVLKPDLVFAMRAAHLLVFPVRGGTQVSNSPVYFVQGYLHYNFGGVKLLCAEKPRSAGEEANPVIEEASYRKIKSELVAKHGHEVDDAVVKRAVSTRRGLEGGDWCLPVTADDVRPLHRDASTL